MKLGNCSTLTGFLLSVSFVTGSHFGWLANWAAVCVKPFAVRNLGSGFGLKVRAKEVQVSTICCMKGRSRVSR